MKSRTADERAMSAIWSACCRSGNPRDGTRQAISSPTRSDSRLVARTRTLGQARSTASAMYAHISTD